MSSKRIANIEMVSIQPGKSIEAYTLKFNLDVMSTTDRGNRVQVEVAGVNTTIFNTNALAIISGAARRAADKYGRVSNEFALDNVKKTFNIHCDDCTIRAQEATQAREGAGGA